MAFSSLFVLAVPKGIEHSETYAFHALLKNFVDSLAERAINWLERLTFRLSDLYRDCISRVNILTEQYVHQKLLEDL